MMKRIIFIVAMLWSVAYGQSKVFIRGDSIVIQKVGGNGELIVENGTRNVTGGVLTNMGNGRTRFVLPSGGGGGSEAGQGLLKTDDTLYVNNSDSLRLDSLQRRLSIAAWGDSHTAGTAGITNAIGGYPSYGTGLFGTYIYNGGVNSQTASMIRDRMIADHAKHDWGQIIYAGFNDWFLNILTARANILPSIQRMLDTLTAVHGHNRYVIVGLTGGGGYGIGTAAYDTMQAINATLAALYPGHYAAVREYLVSKYNPASPADVVNHTNDELPLSLRVDSIHLNNAGYYHFAEYLWVNFRNVLLDTSYSTMYVDANNVMRLLNGQAEQINVADGGHFSIGGQSVAYIPSKSLVPNGALYLGNGGRSSTILAQLNTAAGIDALLSNTDGTGLTAIGASALRSNTTGGLNTAVGRFALYNNTTGSGNTAVGYNALINITTAGSNTAIGNQVLSANTTGIDNTGVGGGALLTCNGCSNTTAVGKNSQLVTSNSANNTSMGFESLRNNTTGASNTSIGSVSGYFNNSGTGNLFAGAFSGWGGASAGTLNFNTFLGYNTGRVIATGADSNVYIGANTVTTTAATGDRNLLAGFGLELPATSTRDYGSIGNVIFMRNGSYGSGVTPFGTGTTAGTNYVGIGVNNPRERLDVDGQVSIRTVNAASVTSVDSVLVMEDGRVKSTALSKTSDGTHAGTLTSIANVASSSNVGTWWHQSGDKVSGSIELSVTPTAGSTTTTIAVELPVASNFAAATDLRGLATSAQTGTGFANVTADTTNDRLEVTFVSENTSAHKVIIFFEYKVI